MKLKLLWFAVFMMAHASFAQTKKEKSRNPVFVDEKGTLRWTANNKEASFFGVNYTVPFAYGYRSHKALGIDPERAIDVDVYHMARLGFDAFRVHVWDTEISDSAGNLLQNEHLRLFDYLLYKLKQHNIKILITPLAFWGNGYPEPDRFTGSFSSIWNKQKVLVTEAAIKAQENYMQQFFRHVNPYTKVTYGADPDVIAMEINNEPHHSGPKEGATTYINRMAAAVRSTGWTKPVFYNISESPSYADAVVKANVDGHSFQWYPTGLVANRTLQGNYLPNVDYYRIPFADTIPAFKKRALMVYEFDAGDIAASYMYPAMARSFRQAGFQWATQFAYDPLYTAHANTEYQTHYLNLAYTPSKAISLMIAGKVFHQLPRFKSYGVFPADTLFDAFRVSYTEDLSEMNTPNTFLYSNNTISEPVNAAALRQVAGVGSSPIVQYNGTGAYFLDQVKSGIWKLEVMPDMFQLSDPFAKASPNKQVRQLVNGDRTMQVRLPDLSEQFEVVFMDKERKILPAENGIFSVKPGIYLLIRKGINKDPELQVSKQNEVIAYPVSLPDSILFYHTPAVYAGAGKVMEVAASIAGADSAWLELRHPVTGWKTLGMAATKEFTYAVSVPEQSMLPGPMEYRILVRGKSGKQYAFPGGAAGDPHGWDALPAQTWRTTVLPANAPLLLFNAAADARDLSVTTANWQQNQVQYGAGEGFPYVHQILRVKDWSREPALAWQLYIGDKIKERKEAARNMNKLVIQAKGSNNGKLQVVLANGFGQAWKTEINCTEGSGIYEVPLSNLVSAPMLLLPRPYPGFQPLYFNEGTTNKVKPDELLFLQCQLQVEPGSNKEAHIELQRIYLEQ